MNDYITFFEQAPINEAYIGKTDILLKVEDQFGIMKKTLKKGQDINSKPEVQKLNRLIEEQFGMNIFCLNIDQTNDTNVDTIPIATRFDVGVENDMRTLVVGSQESGFKFKKGNNLCIIVNMSLSLILDPETTPAELTAAILHEIGHNFADCLDNSIRLDTQKYTSNYYNYLVWRASVKHGRKYRKKLEEKTNKHSIEIAKKETKSNIIRGWIRRLSGFKYDFKEFCKEVKKIKEQPKFNQEDLSDNAKKSAHENMKRNIDRKNEVFADKFSAVYGYAQYQVSGLFKADIHKSKAYNFVEKYYGQEVTKNLDNIMQNYYLFDEHPATIQRANSMMNTLKAELQKEDLDPKLKEMLKKNIDELDKAIKEITTATKNEDERQAVRKAFYKTVNKEAPDALAKDLEDEIDRELDEGLKKGN